MGKHNGPHVSVIVPNYNYARFLNQRIDSILNQTYTDFELILLDDASSDNSRAVLEQYRSNPHVSRVVINEVNSGGVFYQWERGLALASGELIWIAEADDYAAPEFLAECVAELDAHPDTVVCQTGANCVNEHGDFTPEERFDMWAREGGVYRASGGDYIRDHLRWRNSLYNASGVVFRRSAVTPDMFDDIRGYKCCGDWLFWTKMAERGGVSVIREKLSFFRRTSSSVSAVCPSFEDVKVMMWLYDRGHFKPHSVDLYVAIGHAVRREHKFVDAEALEIIRTRCGVSNHVFCYYVFIIVRAVDNIHRGIFFAWHRKM